MAQPVPAACALARSGLAIALSACILGIILPLAGCAGLPALELTRREPGERLIVDQAQARQIISAYRRAHGLEAVALDPTLEAVAWRQAEAMAGADELSHTVDGPLPSRLAAWGADRSAAIENVSAGYDSLDAAISGWRRSPAHNANLLFGPVRRMGIGAATAPTTRFKTFWSLVMTN